MDIVKPFNVFVLCIAFVLISQSTYAAPSHLGIDIHDHVTLMYAGDPSSVCPSGGSIASRSFFRVWPNGGRKSSRFVVPRGRMLVVTDVQWGGPYFLSGTSPNIGESLVLKVAIHEPDGQHRVVIFQSEPVVVTEESAKIGSTEYMTAGFRVGQYRILCAAIDSRIAGFDAGTIDPSMIYLHGYLVDE